MIRRPRLVFRLVIALLALAVVVVPGFAVVSGVSRVTDAFHSFRDNFDSGTSDPPPVVAGAPTGLERGSMLRSENLRAGLRDVRVANPGSRPTLVRVDPNRLTVWVKTRGGSVRSVSRIWSSSRTERGTARPGTTTETTVRWSGIDPAAPQRLFAAVRQGSADPSKQLSYATLFASRGTWVGYRADAVDFDGGKHGNTIKRRH